MGFLLFLLVINMFYEKFLGIPYRHHGRDFNGVDCLGLLFLYQKELFDRDLPDWYYEEDWSKNGKDYIAENYERIAEKVTTLEVHDVVMFTLNLCTCIPNHLGIFVEKPDKIIKATKSGVILCSMNTPVLKNRIEGFYRVCPS